MFSKFAALTLRLRILTAELCNDKINVLHNVKVSFHRNVEFFLFYKIVVLKRTRICVCDVSA